MKKLRIWWNPSFGKESFYVSVVGLYEAKKLLEALADYDNFLIKSEVLDDSHCNCGGLEEFDEDDTTDSPEGSWVEWESSDGEGIDAISFTEAGRIDHFSRT